MPLGRIQHTYVELTGCAEAVGGFHTTDRVKFHAKITDASSGHINEWGFFYSKTETKPDHTNGATKLVVTDTGTSATGWFSFETDAAAVTDFGEKYYVNAYLYDDDNSKYIYQGNAGNETAPDGKEYIIPNVDGPDVNNDTAFTLVLDTDLENDTGPQTEPFSSAFPKVNAGIIYDHTSAVHGTSPEMNAQIQNFGGGDVPPNWVTTINDLSNNHTYKVRSWIEIKTHNASTHDGAATTQRIYHAGDKDANTKDQKQPKIKSNYWTQPPTDQHVLMKFYPDAVDGSDDNRFVDKRVPTNPMEIYFGAKLEDEGEDGYVATKVGFFIGKSANPDHNTNTFEIDWEDIGEPTIIDGLVFNNNPSADDPIVVSGTEHFPIPGQIYYVNAYARDAAGTYYYADDDGHQGQIAPTGVQFNIPKLVKHSTDPLVKITDVGDASGEGEATFNACIEIAINYPGNGNDSDDERGFMYTEETYANLNNGNYYPGHHSTHPFDTNPDIGVVKVEDTTGTTGNQPAQDYNKSISNLSWGKNYYVRPYLYEKENTPNPDVETYFYATKNDGGENDAEKCHWEPAQKFYIPVIANTPNGNEITKTDSSFWINSASNNLDETDGNYSSTPPIYRKGYRWWDQVNSNEAGGTDEWPAAGVNSTEHWPTAEITGLDPETVYEWRAIAEVEQYVGATTYFRIESSETKEIETISPLEVSNTPLLGDFITVGAGAYDGSGMGNGNKFRNITVRGQVTKPGALSTLCKSVGFFVKEHPNKKASYENNANGDGNDGTVHLYLEEEPEPGGDHDIATGGDIGEGDGGALYIPGTTYYVNFYGSSKNVPDAANEFIYEGGADLPPNGQEFQIPDVSNSFIYFESETEMNLRGVVAQGDTTDPGPMTPAEIGFVYTATEPDDNEVSPHKGSVGVEIFPPGGQPETDWTNLVEDNPSNVTFGTNFEIVLKNSGPKPSIWPPLRGEQHYINAFVEDNNGTIYYPLSGNHLSFMMPAPTWVSTQDVGATSFTVTGTLGAAYASWNGIPKKANYGIVYSDDPAADFENGDGTKISGCVDNAGASPPNFTCTLDNLEGATTYYFRVFVEIYKLDDSGGTWTMVSTETKDEETLPDFGEVENKPSVFATNYSITLNGKCVSRGSGDQESDTWGFFVSKDQYPSNTNGIGFQSENPTTLPSSNTSFTRTVPFHELFGGGAGFIPGQTYYVNAYVDDPANTNSNSYRYDTPAPNGHQPPEGTKFTIPKLASSQPDPSFSLVGVNENGESDINFQIQLSGNLETPPKIDDVDVGEKGFYIHTVASPASGGDKIDHNNVNAGSWNSIIEDGGVGILDYEIEPNQDYYFNAYVYDGQNFYYTDTSAAEVPTGARFKLPSITTIAPTINDISGDAVHAEGTNTALVGFKITDVGFLIKDSQGGETNFLDPETPYDIPNTWVTQNGPPLDIFDYNLGGNKPYTIQSLVMVDGEEIKGNEQTFTTHKWPHIIYKDISRNVGSYDASGHIIMKTIVKDFGDDTAEIEANVSQIGFYINDQPAPRSGQNLFSTFNDLTGSAGDIEVQDSSKNDVFLERGKLYYSNTFVSQNNPTVGVVEDDNYQYYGFFNRPPTDASCTTLARAIGGGTFPDGISFIIPNISNSDPEIIDSSTVKLKLHLDSSGDTVDVSGTNRLGFFLNHSTETWADASCNEKAYQDGYALDLDLPTISVAGTDTVEEGASSSSHLLQNPHIFSNIVNFSSTTYRKIIINVSSWRVLITPDDPHNQPGNGWTEHYINEREEGGQNFGDLVNPISVEIALSGTGSWNSCSHVVSASGEVWNDASNNIWNAARIIGNSLWEIDGPAYNGNYDVRVEWKPTNSTFAAWGGFFQDWDQTNNPPFRVTSAKVIVTAIEDVPLACDCSGILETSQTLTVEDASVILSSITYSNDTTGAAPDATWTGLDEQDELNDNPPNDEYDLEHVHSYADKIFATGSSVTFEVTATTEPTGVNDLDASASIYVYYKNSDDPTIVRDISKVLIPEMDPWSPINTNKIKGDYFLDASGLIAGRNYYYTGYTALLPNNHDGDASNNQPLRGESVDGDDYWYPPGYISEDSTNNVKTFCIGDSSCNPTPSSKTETETTLIGRTLGNPPFPYNNEYGFVYWFDGSNNYDNREFLTSSTAPGDPWTEIELTNLKSSTRYYALPYFKQGTNYIYGGFDRDTYENLPTIWYTDLEICEVSLNKKGDDFPYGNYNNGNVDGEGGGLQTGDASGSQTRYKLVGIDASLNTNPPDNFILEDGSGSVTELGLCWKVSDDPLDENEKATRSDFFKNLLYDGSFNGWKDVNQTGAKDVLVDASYNIYDASINDLSYNTMYSLRTYAKNEPVVDNNLVVGAQQSGGGIGYSGGDWFITPLPKVIMEDPSANPMPIEDDENIPSYADGIATKIGISGEILDNPDEASGNIIEYGFLFKMFTPSMVTVPTDYPSFNNETCDISTNVLGGGPDGNIFYPDNVIDTSFNSEMPHKFFQDFSLYPSNGEVKDLSYNRQYYFGSYARNLSDHYLKHSLVEQAITNGDESYINTDGITSYKKQNNLSGVLITPWPTPFIKIIDLLKPITLTGDSEYSFVNASLEIFNYDPTKWGGIAEFGVIWEKSENLDIANIEPDELTIEYMDGSGGWADGSGGWYRRGCSGELVDNFREPVDGSRNGGWFWDEGGANVGQGWQYDASFSSGGFPSEENNESCRWPLGEDNYIKLGVYKLGLAGSIYPSELINHKPPPEGFGSAQDPSSIPLYTETSYWFRPYIIARNDGFWADTSFNIYYGEPKSLVFDLDPVGVRTGHTLIDANGVQEKIDWAERGYTGKGSEEWPSLKDVGIDSADMSGNIWSNPLIGDPQRGRIIKYGFLWWDGGKTAVDGAEVLQWPGQNYGIGPVTAAGSTVPNLGFTLENTEWPPDGSNNYCVPMTYNTQANILNWNDGSDENEGRSTFDISGTNFDISANDPRDGGKNHGSGVTEPDLGYYWNTTQGEPNEGWFKLAFPKDNPPWTDGNGPDNEPSVITTQTVIFDIKKTSRADSREDRLYNSTVWYRAYAINRYFNKNSNNEAQESISYGTVGRLELKKSVNFGVDMENPVLISSNIGSRSILVTGSLLGNIDGTGNSIIENYGFCWRKLIENPSMDASGEIIQDEDRVPAWYYDASVCKCWTTRLNDPFPPPTVIDSSMVAFGLRSDNKIWDDEAPIPLELFDPSNQKVVNFDPSGQFPGDNENNLGFTQNPPIFKFGDREWKFHYKIGSDGEELVEEGGIKDSNFVGFDASGGRPISNTYYLIRSWAKGPIDPATKEDDDGETASGIKYGPIWYINADTKEENKRRGWLCLTKKLEACLVDDVEIKNPTYRSVILKSKLLANPDPSRLNSYGFVYMLDDASKNGIPTIENDFFVVLDDPELVGDVPPFKNMEKQISLSPNSWYTIRAFANNSFEIDGVEEGGIYYSNPLSILSNFCPPGKTKMISVKDVSYVTVELKGEVLSNFNGLITQHGFIVGTNAMPVIDNSLKYDLGSKNDLGYYTHIATGLSYDTTYFVRSFVYHPDTREDLRLQYSNKVKTFTTLKPDPPQILSIKQLPNALGYTSATFSSEIQDTSGIELLKSYGFCWTTRIVPLSNPEGYDDGDAPLDSELKLENAEGMTYYEGVPNSFPFTFVSKIMNLMPSTTYYIRSWAKINPVGYGQVYTFTTLDEPCDCIPPTAKPIGELKPNKSSKRLCAEAIKRHGSAIIGTQGVTPNLT